MHNPTCVQSSVPANCEGTSAMQKVHLVSKLDRAVADSYSYIGCTPVAVDTGYLDILECYHNNSVQQVVVEMAAVAVVAAAAAAAAAVDKLLDTVSEPVLIQYKVRPQQLSNFGFVECNFVD